LQQKAAAEKSGNVIISPVSIQSAVTLAMFGAAGETKKEMLDGLKYTNALNDDAIAANYQKFGENVRKTSGLKIGKKIREISKTR
jgi:serine protease inhibitor